MRLAQRLPLALAFALVVSLGADGADTPRPPYAGGEPNAPWRKAAAERIEKHRKGDLTVVVTNRAGRPVANAKVEVHQTRLAFGLGSCVTAKLLTERTTDARKYRECVERMFNKVVFENDLKWPVWEDKSNRAVLMKALTWLEERKIPVRGHCLMWPAYSHWPKHMEALKGNVEALSERSEEHIRDEVGALRGRICEWDVTNETLYNCEIIVHKGPQVIADWFKMAHEADPAALLFMNEAVRLDGQGVEYFEKTAKVVNAKGRLMHGIGVQCHMPVIVPPAKLIETLDRLAPLGCVIQATEVDLLFGGDRLRARYLRDFMTALFSHPSVNGILLWGFWEGSHWQPGAALYHKDWTLREHGQAWMDVVEEWRTEADGRTAGTGRYTTRGFVGDYEVTVRARGRTRTVRAALPATGATVAVRLP